MSYPIDQTNFLAVLRQAIPDTNWQKAQILNYAKKQLVLLAQIQACAEINDPVVQRAINLYLRANPEAGGIPPSLPELIRWLRGRRGLEYTAQLEKKLGQIRKKLDTLGTIDPRSMVLVHPGVIATLRLLAGFTVYEDE